MNYEDNDMQDSDPKSIYESLLRLAFENPRAARAEAEGLLRCEESVLSSVLALVAGPGNGRLRQLIANAAASEQDRKRLQPHLDRWLAVETDEFARRAIEEAQTTPGEKVIQEKRVPPVSDPLLVDMYRYVTGRIGHELRNALLAPQTRLLKLRSAVEQIEDADAQSSMGSLVSQLEDDFAMVGRICEFNPSGEYFAIRSYVLCDWIKAMNTDYALRYNAIDVCFDGNPDAHKARVLGSHHLLRTVFWNLWVNSHQATGDPCKIRVRADLTGSRLTVTLLDTGEGFPDQLDPLIFKDQVSTKSPHRGRGLLEVQHAMGELQGHAHLVRQASGELRVALTFPLEVR